jgi:NAD(P)-dependent dehydrogenase (short-subunit alcohol dehydrogenase family)
MTLQEVNVTPSRPLLSRQSKLANVLFASELARRHPSLRSVSVHPGVVETGLVTALPAWRRRFVTGTNRLMGKALLPPAQGSYSQLWCAAGAPSADLVNGAYYMPIGVMSNASLDAAASSEALARELWAWTEGVLANF